MNLDVVEESLARNSAFYIRRQIHSLEGRKYPFLDFLKRFAGIIYPSFLFWLGDLRKPSGFRCIVEGKVLRPSYQRHGLKIMDLCSQKGFRPSYAEQIKTMTCLSCRELDCHEVGYSARA